MGIFVNPDNLAFQVALNSEIYVDKTGLLKYTNKVMNTLQGYICNSRPRRFGKSITANMLTAYYSMGCSSAQMFTGLEISKDPDFEKHLNQYDVIHLDMQYYFKPVREMPTGRGFADFAFLPKPEFRNDYPALVVELKWNKNAQTAMQQIKYKKL